MKTFLEGALAVYIVSLGLAVALSVMTRIADPENCKVVVADYVFLGLTRLPCEVK